MKARLLRIGIWILVQLPVASFAQTEFQNGTFDLHGPLQNGDAGLFRTGSTYITGWVTVPGTNGTYTGAVGYLRDDGTTLPGGHHAQDPGGVFVELGQYFGLNGLQQTFSTLPNQPYLVTFWSATDPFNGPPAQFRVSAGGSVADYTALPRDGTSERWQPNTFFFTSDGSGASTLTFQNGAGTVGALDTIAVTPVPEPSTWVLLCLGASAFILVARRNGRAASSKMAAIHLWIGNGPVSC